MNIKRSILGMSALAVVAGGTLFGVSIASASSDTPRDDLVQKLAESFNVSEDEVQAVFDEHHEEMQADRNEKFSTHLQELVDASTITAAQKTYLLDHHKATQDKLDKLRDSDASRATIHAAMETAKDEIKNWADEQGIDLADIRPEGRPERHGRHGAGMLRGGSAID